MNLNVFKWNCGYRWNTWRGFWDNLLFIPAKFKYAYQRITKGYCDRDAWNLDSYYSDLFSSTLVHLSEISHSCPSSFYNEYGEDGFNKWRDLLLKMAVKCKQLDINDEIYNNPYDYDTQHDEWANRIGENNAAIAKNKEEVFEFFKEHFYNLWD